MLQIVQNSIMEAINKPTFWSYKETYANSEWSDVEFEGRGVLELYIEENMRDENAAELYNALGTYEQDFILGQYVYDENDERKFIKEVEVNINIEADWY